MNVFLYRNYYNGGGVALGDFDSDGLEDVFLTANRLPNRLYRNLGDFHFEDISELSGAQGEGGWSTGASVADVNGDGLLDIYVCNSGEVDGSNRRNELFINQGNAHFSEQAAAYGLDDNGFSTHASFFDYDHDGDLDCFVLNNSFRPIATLGLRNLRAVRDSLGGDRLYRNDNGRFVDVSEAAGIFGSVIGFGLGVSIGDVDLDGWEDIYVSNDFYERDYLYINQGDGTFSEELPDRIFTHSNFSMGADIADLNNDGLPEIFVTDMLPGDDARLKQTTKFPDYNEYTLRVERGFHHQAMRNTLQVNRGDGTFAELGQQAGVNATDWSWGALLADLDNNGYRDIFVSNGAYKDVTDQDFIHYMSSDPAVLAAQRGEAINFNTYVDRMPSTRVPNAAFANLGILGFADSTAAWGLSGASHANGAAYGDLDLDGDLDLIVNNLNQPVSLYRNTTVESGGDAGLRIRITGTNANTHALGSRIWAYSGEEATLYQHFPIRGFQSSMSYYAHLTTPDMRVDSLVAQDTYGNTVRLTPNGHDLIDLNFNSGRKEPMRVSTSTNSVLTPATGSILTEPIYHTEDTYSDFDRDPLLLMSNALDGPAFATGSYAGEANGIMYIGGSASAPGQLLAYDGRLGKYRPIEVSSFISDRAYEDGAAVFLDYDRDGDDDLIVGSSGSEYFGLPKAYALRFYEQVESTNGQPTFQRARRSPVRNANQPVSDLLVADVNADGLPDLVSAGRLNAFCYGQRGDLSIHLGTPSGRFTSVKLALPAPYTNALPSAVAFGDVAGDERPELVVVGEYMPIIVFSTELELFDTPTIANAQPGLFRSVALVGRSGHDKKSIVAGNLGTNTFFSNGSVDALRLRVGDLSADGQPEHIYSTMIDGVERSVALKHELERRLPSVKKSFVKYSDFADKELSQIFPTSTLDSMLLLEAAEFSSLLVNWDDDMGYTVSELPEEVQRSIVFAVAGVDVDADGQEEIVLGGNLYGNQPRLGQLDASRGVLLEVAATTPPQFAARSLGLTGQLRHIQPLAVGDFVGLCVVRNSGALEFFTVRKREEQ